MSPASRRPAAWGRGVVLLLLLLAAGLGACERPAVKGLRPSVKKFSDLAAEGVRIGIVDPDLGPAGRYAEKILARYRRIDPAAAAAIEKNIVTYESHVRALLDKLLQKEIDAGFIYRSDTLHNEEKLKVVTVPAACAVVPEYALARLRETRQPAAVGVFIDWLTGPAAAGVWKAYGFKPRPVETAAGKLPGAASFPPGSRLTVFAAAVFYSVLPVLARQFQSATGVEVSCEFAGSGRLYSKLVQGAVGSCGADLFLSAAPRYVNDLVARGLADRARVFMGNELVVAVPR